MKRVLPLLCLLVGVAMGAAGCRGNASGPNPPQPVKSPGSPVTDASSVADRLRAVGLKVERGEEVEQPFFSITGTMISVLGEDIQIFQYPDSAAADAQAAPISPDGSTVGTAKPFWIGSPHFYKNGKLLVLYVGDNDTVLQALEAVLGRQFAGKK